ncbi:NAD(P)H-dependent flavin oxidoreductase [Brevibacterium album]|uniref:NAD(P)H-dependent flavin oxidoreductase n=1 Tax=Brevibacterium album TaxID=417948 RepID=UPI000423423B|nr:nitronate monooxygenase [Brevibacterium album]
MTGRTAAGAGAEAGTAGGAMRERLPAHLARRLRLPAIAAPMLRVSGTELVREVCRAGAIGAFPTVNPRPPEALGDWLDELDETLTEDDAPYCPNLIMRRPGIAEEVEILLEHRVEMVITSVGSPAPVLPALHEAGVFVFADVATVRHARQAVEAGADGLVLLTAGAGGNTGWLNPFAFVRQVRQFFDGAIALAGGMSDGTALRAARTLGADLGYIGTAFIATRESMAQDGYKDMVVESTMDDVLLTRAFTGLNANFLVPSIRAVGLDPESLEHNADLAAARARYGGSGRAEERTAEGDLDTGRPRRWKDIWSAGHSVSGVSGVVPARAVIERLAGEYAAA